MFILLTIHADDHTQQTSTTPVRDDIKLLDGEVEIINSNFSRNMKQVLMSGLTQADVAGTEGDEM